MGKMPSLRDIRDDKSIVILVLSATVVVASFILGQVAIAVAATMGIDNPMIPVIVRTFVSLGALLVLGGGKWLRFNLRNIRQTWSWYLPLVMINCLLGGLTLVGMVFGALGGNIVIHSLFYWGSYVALLCLLAGVNEEVTFRGLAYGGMLDTFGSKNGIVWAAVGSSLLFGAAHILFDFDLTNWYVVAMEFLKTVLAWL